MVRLVRKLGSVERTAARLGIGAGLVERFTDGLANVPDALLLKALDLMSESAETPALRPASKTPRGPSVI